MVWFSQWGNAYINKNFFCGYQRVDIVAIGVLQILEKFI